MRADDAAAVTREGHASACCDPVFDWDNRQDFESAARGLIHRPNDASIRDAEGTIV